MADELTPAFFTPLVGSEFTVDLGNESATIVLEAVTEHASVPGAPRTLPFSLRFLGTTGTHLPQRIYALQHSAVGQLQIFLVPIGPAADGRQQFEAVFN